MRFVMNKCLFRVDIWTCVLGLVLAGSARSSGQTAQKPAAPSDAEDFSLELPNRDKLFRPESEAEARDRIRATAAQAKLKVAFPTDSLAAYARDPSLENKPWQTVTYPECITGYHRTYFEDPRTELCLRSLGFVEPIRSALFFYAKVIALPARLVCLPVFTIR
jgi:hypothetical protein